MWVPEYSASSIIGNQVLVYNLVRFYNIFNSFYILLSEQYEISKSVYWILSSSMSYSIRFWTLSVLLDHIFLVQVQQHHTLNDKFLALAMWIPFSPSYLLRWSPLFTYFLLGIYRHACDLTILAEYIHFFLAWQICMFGALVFIYYTCFFSLWRHVVDRSTWLFLHVNRFIFWFGMKLNHKLGLLACGFRMQYVEMAGIPSS